MELYVLIGQRKERYEGEYGLEALAVASYADMDGNPDYMPEQLQEHRDRGEFDALAVITLEVSSDAVREALYPKLKPISAKLVEAA